MYLMTLREQLERDAFAIELEQRKLQQQMMRTSDPLERRRLHLKLQGLAGEHQRALAAIFALDRGV